MKTWYKVACLGVICMVILDVGAQKLITQDRRVKASQEEQPSNNPTKIFIGRQESVNQSCQEDSSLDEFPDDLFTEEQRRNGAIILHLMGAIYCFTLLAVVCNDYFLPAIECICIDLRIPKDVAAATFMSTATTMPEFFTNTISTLITHSEMGLGNIIGSLMFNTLGVAALSALAINKSIQLDWWPVCRDCVIYSFHTIVLIIVAWGGVITFWETFVMVCLCLCYYVIIIITNYKLKGRLRVFVEDHLNCCSSTRYDLTLPAEHSAKGKLPLEKEHNHHHQDGVFAITPSEFSNVPPTFKEKEYILDEDDLKKRGKSLFRCPEGGILRKIWWLYTWPIKLILTCLCPDPKKYRKLYPITFIMCIAFIGANSFIIVWMLTVFGTTFKIPDVVMGLTFLSAGSAMPEALSSIMSVRKGESGIGVSNALGANSLAILLSLGVPWFIHNIVNYNVPGKNVIHISSYGIEYTLGILVLSTISLFVILTISGFRLRRRVGLALITVWGVFIVLQVLIEMNIFWPWVTEC